MFIAGCVNLCLVVRPSIGQTKYFRIKFKIKSKIIKYEILSRIIKFSHMLSNVISNFYSVSYSQIHNNDGSRQNHNHRAGARKSGRDGEPRIVKPEERFDHMPHTQHYPVEDVLVDLLEVSRRYRYRHRYNYG